MDMIFENVCKSFGDRTVLKNFSAVFPRGSISTVMGPSGGGKTTLLNLMLGLLKSDSGRLEGLPASPAVVFQEDRLCEGFSAVSNIRLVTGDRVSKEEILRHLELLGIGDSAEKPVRQLSGGMRRRVALARAVLYGGDALILDEAFKGLDPDTRRMALEYVMAHRGDRTLICVTHDQQEADFFGGQRIRVG